MTRSEPLIAARRLMCKSKIPHKIHIRPQNKVISSKMKISSVFMLTLLSSMGPASAERLRGAKGTERKLQKTFECTVKLVHGMSYPDKEELPPLYVCEAGEQGDLAYNLVGDVESFFEGEDVSSGIVNINVPYSVVGEDYEINFDQHSSKIISVSYDRRRKLFAATGTKKILVVRVSDDHSNDDKRKVQQSETKMYWDVFGDENNLRKVYKNCSGGQLNIQPATGPGVTKGVITIKPRSNVCDVSYLVIANEARKAIENQGIDKTNAMFIMPNCLNWGNGAAWGDVNGPYTYFPTENASYPMTQVHELGHNLGLRHSGKDGISYGDDTCYMGNRVPWTDEGAKMCFNAAKLWYLGWFSDLHFTSKPEHWSLDTKLIGINESNNRKFLVDQEKTILRLQSGGPAIDLFVIYNHGIGVNKQVVGDKNKVVITEQSGQGGQSEWKAALGPGAVYKQNNWGQSKNKVLVIQNCGTNPASWTTPKKLAAARVIVYVEGETYASCSGDNDNSFDDDDDDNWNRGNNGNGKNTCTDYPGFHDFYGPEYDCAWYAQASYLCTNYGAGPANDDGFIANEACCTCGGGTWSIANADKGHISDMPPKAQVQAIERQTDNDEECKDAEGWHDSNGGKFTCDWYAQDNERCEIMGLFFGNFGMTAQEACCACQI